MNEENESNQPRGLAALRAWFDGIEGYNGGPMSDDQVVMAVKHPNCRPVQVTAGDIREILGEKK